MANYYTILTHTGKDKVAAAMSGGPALQLAQMAVGDGGGPGFYDQYDRDTLKGRNTLVNQQWVEDLNLVDQDPQNPAWVITEGLIPTHVGGWYIREVGIFDLAGDLIAIGVYPETYKPVATAVEADLLVRSILEVGDADNVELKIDPSQVMATRAWVLEVAVPQAMVALDDKVDEAAGHADRAELASEVAFTNADAYEDTAAGLAATSDGEQFQVIQGDEFVRYRNDAGVAVEVGRYPSSKGFKTLVAGVHGNKGLAPYTSFDDGVRYAEVDKNGLRMDLPYVFTNFDSRTKAMASPYLSFHDAEHLVQVDRVGKPLDERMIYSRTRLSPYLSYHDDKPMEDFDRGGKSLSPLKNGQDQKVVADLWEGPIYVEFNKEEEEISVAWVHEPGRMLKQVWRPNGANKVFNYHSIYQAPFSNSPGAAAWEQINQVSTDHIPPITHNVTTGDFTASGVSTTGGNHTGPNGELTGFMTVCNFFLNDSMPMTEDFAGFASSVLVTWSNDIYAGNTIFQERVTTLQEVSARFTARNVEVYCKVTALEPMRITREGGTQMTTSGWRDEFHFYGGKNQGPEVYSSAHSNSGTKAEAPDVWACVCKSYDLGYFAAWIDREYGVKSDYVADADYLSHKNTSKLYNFTVRNEADGHLLDAGESYEWRGGYSYAPIGIVDGLDGAWIFRQGNKLRLAVANSADQTGGNLKLTHEFIGADFSEIGSISGIGTHVDFGEYSARPHKEIVQ